MTTAEIKPMEDLEMHSPNVNFVSPHIKDKLKASAKNLYEDPVAAPFAGRRSKHANYNIISNKESFKTAASSSLGATLHTSEDPLQSLK